MSNWYMQYHRMRVCVFHQILSCRPSHQIAYIFIKVVTNRRYGVSISSISTVCSTAGSTTIYWHLWGNPLVTGRFDKGPIIWQVFSFNDIVMICLMKSGNLSAGLQHFAMQICDTGRILLLFHDATLPNVGRYGKIYKSVCMGTSRWCSTIRLNICQGSHLHAMLLDIVCVWNACSFQTC